MIMADVLKIFLIVVGLMLVTVCYWLASEALFPRLVRRARDHFCQRPLMTTFAGILLATPLGLVGAGLSSAGSGPAKAVGFALLAVPLFLGLMGAAGLARRIGEGLPTPLDETQPWRPVLRGGVVLSFLCLLPLFGWFLLLPWILVAGAGAAFRAGWQLRRESREVSRDPVEGQGPMP